MQTLAIWYVAAVALGAVFAYLVTAIFTKLAPAGTTAEYWTGVGSSIHGLLYGDESEYWRHYRSLIGRTARYVGRQIAAVVLAFAPLVVTFLALAPWIFAQWDRGHGYVVVPEQAGEVAGTGSSTEEGVPRLTLTLADGVEVTLPRKAGAFAVCGPSRFGCLVLQGFGFTAVTVESSGTLERSLVIVRTAHDDWNPLWPYLSDPEFLFFVALSLGAVLLSIRGSRSAQVASPEFGIGLVDHLMTQFAWRNARSMRRLGDWETRLFGRRLARLEISNPIFIAGLARSGTTILLEKLATARGIATHRYRDFPFVMTPIVWNGFLSLFSTKQRPSERPHKDKIKITRDSPDAFEEPIWQYYFPAAHDPAARHVLDARAKNEEFARFYQDHVRKILLLRKGQRYLSKGNYNLPRIEYLDSIFDAPSFLVPVRHPLTHIESLVRQHELFTGYATEDPRVGDYLRAVGHYEFGPQRLPVCMEEGSGKAIVAAWARGEDLIGYALQWRDVYRYVADLWSSGLRERLCIVRFESLCAHPEPELERILDFAGLSSEVSAAALAEGIEPSSHRCRISSEMRDRCWEIVGETARWYGYSENPEELTDVSHLSAPVVLESSSA